MKLSLLLFIISLLSLSLFAQGADKVALLVGISSYPADSGWSNIHGENDLDILAKALEERGFKNENIYVLAGKKATKKNIIKSLNDLSSKVAKGGFFVTQFSGHGQQVQDLNGDENDSFDEALVPYDAPKFSESSTYKGEKHLIDDDFAALFQPIREQLGEDGQCLILVDACHSGTLARSSNDESFYRGGELPLKFSDKQRASRNTANTDTNYGFFDNSDGRSNLAETVLISATRASDVSTEHSAEDKWFGPLSFAFCEVLKMQGDTTDYATLLSKLQEKVNAVSPGQVPVLEGKKNLTFGNNTLSPLADFYTVLTKRGNTATIDAGKLLKIHEGSEFVFYTSDTDTAAVGRVAYGEVVKADLFSAETEIRYLPGKSRKDLFKAYLTKQDFGELKLSIKIDFADKNLEAAVTKRVHEIAALSFANAHPDIKLKQNGNELKVLRNGQTIQTHMLKNNDTHSSVSLIIDTILLTYVQAEFFSALPSTDKNIKLSGRLIPIQAKMNEKGDCIDYINSPQNIIYDRQGRLIISLNTCYEIEITNSGDSTAYYAIIDIDSSNDYSVLTPHGKTGKSASNYQVPPKTSVIIPFDKWGIWKPTGTEEFVIIGANAAIDIKDMSISRGTKGTATNNSLVKLYEQSWRAFSTETTRGESDLPPVIPSDFSVSRFFVEVVE